MAKTIQDSEVLTILILFGGLFFASMLPAQSFGQENQTQCDPSYSGACVPVFPPDLNCPDVNGTNIQVNGTDSHKLDADKDGIACER
jgi:micrococcal nuclease